MSFCNNPGMILHPKKKKETFYFVSSALFRPAGWPWTNRLPSSLREVRATGAVVILRTALSNRHEHLIGDVWRRFYVQRHADALIDSF
jgi:hypothetical protein